MKLQEKDKYIHQIRGEALNEKADIEQQLTIVSERNKEIVIREESLQEIKESQCATIQKLHNDIRTLIDDKRSLEFQLQSEITHVTDKCDYANEKVKMNEGTIGMLNEQLNETRSRIKNLEAVQNVDRSGVQGISFFNQSVEECINPIVDPKVLLLHDSLCRNINNTILSRENVETEKIWAPSLGEMVEAIEQVEDNVDVIVLEALTRDVTDTNCETMVALIDNAVEKACSKAKKVVVNSIVSRDDNDTVKIKAEMINATIKFKFLDNQRVVICDNKNLDDSKYRTRDGVHLTQRGTSLLAGNLKASIADALDITIKKRLPRGNRWPNPPRNQGRHGFFGQRNFFDR